MTEPRYHVAQINVGRARAPLDDPLMAPFVDALDRINALAEASPGFVWRLQTESGNATDIQAFEDPRVILNMSVWRRVEDLRNYVYRTDHMTVLRRRDEWFEPRSGPHLALWWVPVGHRPTPEEGRRRLEQLQAEGPGAAVFTFATPAPAPGAGRAAGGAAPPAP